MNIRYITEEFNGKTKHYLLLGRKIGEMETETCPFCGSTHIHGIGAGHRVAHCHDPHRNVTLVAEGGIVLNNEDGYYVEGVS